MNNVVGMFQENTSNASGNKLMSFLNEAELVICNGRQLVTEPEWTGVRSSLKQRVSYRLHNYRCSVDEGIGCCKGR